MWYHRVLSVLAVVTALVVGAVVVGRSSHGSHPVQLRRAGQQLARKFVSGHRTLRPFPWVISGQPQFAPLTAQATGTTCEVASSCSITPCVVPVASDADLVVPARPTAAARCPKGDRGPRPMRVAAAF